ncbi:MAG: tRNA (N6-isopentenyl adenosine(37)-C2)-methylthiotransferase MiaB [Desulfobacteraceae bacterium]|nr:MAG: tRNA (N6-isopentenyl adenosine(37)-C2)-methylthiotransferase MiaB [Desulfobacteraceae bacterium]
MKSNGQAYIHTIGCQMNVYDSQKLAGILTRMGYRMAAAMDDADLVVCNTCSIRHKSEEKAFSFLGRFAEKKKTNPHLITVMAGCVAQQEGEKAFSRLPHLNLVLGTQAFERFESHIKALHNGKRRITDIEGSASIFEAPTDSTCFEENTVSRFVTIMQGCDNYCTYCVVPYVRGRERSRSADSVLDEIRTLCDNGVGEITLLGQNVNSYGQKEGMTSFAGLLGQVCGIDGVKRIRFATSHPKDLSDELIHAIAGLDKVCNHIHLPVQSGSSRILKKMNRGYTRAHYLSLISKLKDACPGIALSTDIIVGFPSETQEDFEDTMSLLSEVGFDSIFAFAYSDRSSAPAAKFPDQVDEKEKRARLNRLLALQEDFTIRKNIALVGQTVQILVEGKSTKPREGFESEFSNNQQMMGRTESNKIVHFPAGEKGPAIGDLIDIRIENAYAHSLWGSPVRDMNSDEE